jgi:hypothetical protein
VFVSGDTETVVRIRPPARDPFGDPGNGGGPDLEIGGCLFAPGGSAENNIAANQVDTDATVYCPPGTTIAATDRIRARGVLYQVVGDPQVWGSSGIAVQLRRVTG